MAYVHSDSTTNIVRATQVVASKVKDEIPKGTLVWVTPKIGPQAEANTSRQMVERHGNLWVVDGIAMRGDGPKPAWYWCKAVSSGYIYDWRTDELEVQETEEPNNVRQDETNEGANGQ